MGDVFCEFRGCYMFYQILPDASSVFTWCRFWPSVIVIACVSVCCVYMCVKLESPNFDQRCKTSWVRVRGWVVAEFTLTFKVKFNFFKSKFTQTTLFMIPIVLGVIDPDLQDGH